MSALNISECPGWYRSVTDTVPTAPPCGESLEYDPDFILLQREIQPRLGAEYGNFVEAVEPVNWAETERNALKLLQRSIDVRLVIILMRCRLRQIGLSALPEGLKALIWMLNTWPEHLHPQLLDEGEFTPIMRANAFAELESNEGFLADIRQQTLPTVSGLHVTIRDIERASSSPRDEDALSEETRQLLLHEWQTQDQPLIQLFKQTFELTHLLKEMLQQQMPGEDAPELTRLLTLSGYFLSPSNIASDPPPAEATDEPEPRTKTVDSNPEIPVAIPADTLPMPPQKTGRFTEKITSRNEALQRLREVRTWFTQAEPSSPVITLLAFTEQTIGKSFTELLQLLPPEVIAKMTASQE
ncbi:type VI secretion system protein ImpA [Izhakiella capsodis]|uniref:Type VI secretion system protein ImpA n=1 Tax=Izhakiella capsodis TaxID=1367852 RepID=A0A1I5A1W5_9GAMM|nr:type VI secretion system ImpA family N-terminal domain-containing protein [Izhakiella capsodis]SFN56481.1 type VI secretion system protein ImpA [Izhakiella capsodis]